VKRGLDPKSLKSSRVVMRVLPQEEHRSLKMRRYWQCTSGHLEKKDPMRGKPFYRSSAASGGGLVLDAEAAGEALALTAMSREWSGG
jgi:hypothetical protein